MRRTFLLLLPVLACHVPTATATLASTVPDAAPAPLSPEALARRAASCFEDPLCPLADATRDFLAADEAGAPEVDCFRFYYGTGVPEDPARARRCFERNLAKTTCGSSSPDLERLYLAVMRVDAQGGPRDADGARALLKDCYADVSVSGALGTKRTKGPVDFCRDLGGTTLSMQACAGVNDARADFERQRAVKTLFAALDDAGKARYAAATKAFARYEDADSTRAGDVYRGGSLRPQTEVQHGTGLLERRAKRLANPKGFPPASAADVTLLEGKLTALRDRFRKAADADGRVVFDAAEAEWEAYAVAELAFYTQAFGVDPSAVRAELVRDRLTALK
ncbi:MAG TPA: lysozyme inhibitor LprI family protein [Polyangiaceae bacterium]